MVHRDIKPENIVLQGSKPGGKICLTDFGGVQHTPANASEEEEDMEMGTVVGTYGYMAPEQLRGAARPASDLFALGGTLLYLLSGMACFQWLFPHVPFTAGTSYQFSAPAYLHINP